jgi:hypothetical protein
MRVPTLCFTHHGLVQRPYHGQAAESGLPTSQRDTGRCLLTKKEYAYGEQSQTVSVTVTVHQWRQVG